CSSDLPGERWLLLAAALASLLLLLLALLLRLLTLSRSGLNAQLLSGFDQGVLIDSLAAAPRLAGRLIGLVVLPLSPLLLLTSSMGHLLPPLKVGYGIKRAPARRSPMLTLREARPARA